jgi:hypothetical protein
MFRFTIQKATDKFVSPEDTMLSKAALDFLLRITDWFHGHWEDPEWGKLPGSQILIAVALRDLASGIQDGESREAIQSVTDKVIAKNSQVIAKKTTAA